ncbi:MAG: tandem-95 repeat protein, partial [Actinobacteria bacterium]|nr:tandem-95 repeat protein [Actinomycetota bacterium]
PVAVDDTATTAEDTPVSVDAPGVLGNDSDADGDTLTATKVSAPAHGSVTLNADGSLSYTPAANYNGPDSFTYKANDGSADSNVATVNIAVNAVNDTPVAVNDAYSTTQDSPLTVVAPGVLTNDTDIDSPNLIAIKVSDPAHGTVTLNADGSFTYTPGAGYSGTDSFTYKANDGSADSNVATVNLTVTAPTGPTTLTVADISVNEGDAGTTAATFTVTRSGNTSGTSTVKYTTAGGTATSGTDYTPATAGTLLSFAAGDTSKTVTVQVNGDTLNEKDETFNLTLSTPSSGTTIADTVGTATIVNDDAPAYLGVADIVVNEGDSGTTPATFTVTRSGNTTGTSTVSVKTSGGTAVAGTDYAAIAPTTLTFGPGVTTQTVDTTVTGDLTDEANETFNLVLSGAVGATASDTAGTATIVDNEGAVTAGPTTFLTVGDLWLAEGNSGTTPATFTVTRSGNTSAASTVKYTTAGGTATSGTDYTPVTPSSVMSFGAGDTSATVTVQITGDALNEKAETFNFTLSGASTGTTVSDPVGTATIVNDDAPAYLTVANLNVWEGQYGTNPATFTITRSGNLSGTSTVSVKTSGGTAVAGTDYAAIAPTTLTFGPGVA